MVNVFGFVWNEMKKKWNDLIRVTWEWPKKITKKPKKKSISLQCNLFIIRSTEWRIFQATLFENAWNEYGICVKIIWIKS